MINISKRFQRLYEKLDSLIVPDEIKSIINYFKEHKTLDYNNILKILYFEDEELREHIYKIADIVNKELNTDIITLKGVIEFSNYCKKGCYYCGIRVQNEKLKRYRISVDEMFNIAKNGVEMGLTTIILQSGEDDYYTDEMLERLIYKIHHELKTAVSISIGERSKEAYKKFREAGASKVLLKHETINKEIFDNIHPDKDYDLRIELLDYLVELGYITGSGNIIGLPGQSLEDIAKDILFMKEHNIKMIGMGPFISSQNTPLENYENGSAELTLNTYAATRLSIPFAQMPATTALGTIDRDFQYKALNCGCNVIMVNITPDEYRENYNIYDKKIKVDLVETAQKIIDMGLRIPPFTLRKIFKEA
ncbi:[FeFe] hydrogenase H-cluster radical SAM maturase HydE [Marinitoga arctica]